MQIEVSLSDLEAIRAALNSAYCQNVALDLLDGYRKMTNSKPSAVTAMFNRALDLVDDYLHLPEEEPDDE